MTTPIDRESVEQERDWAMAELVHAFEQAAQAVEELSKSPGTTWGQVKAHIRAMGDVGDRSAYTPLRAALDAAEAENKRLRQLIPRPDQTEDELAWRDHMRGVPLAALAKEFGVTRERMRHRLKKIAEKKLHLTENPDG